MVKPAMHMETVSALVSAARDGETGAFALLVERFQDMAYAGAYTVLNDAGLAEDAAQEAFTEAFFNLDKLREPAAFPGWFRRIVFKQSDRLVRGKQLATTPLEGMYDVAVADVDLEQLVEEREMHTTVRRAVADLPERERVVVLLFYSTGYSLKEIAAFLEVPVTTVKKRLFDARQRLKIRLLESAHDFLHEQRRSALVGFSDKVGLLIAVREGDLAAVRSLLDAKPMLVNMKAERDKHSANRHSWIGSGLTPLYEAASSGKIEMVALLLDYGAAMATKSYDALKGAVRFDHAAIVAFLLARGADVEGRLRDGQRLSDETSREPAPLSLAAMKGNTLIAQLLLEHGADVNAVGPTGRTALHWAALKGEAGMVNVLLENRARMSMEDELGRTALDWARARGHQAVMGLLHDGVMSHATSP